MMHKLNHPNTLRFHNWYSTRNHVWLILEYCEGADLRRLMAVDKRLPESAVKVRPVNSSPQQQPNVTPALSPPLPSIRCLAST